MSTKKKESPLSVGRHTGDKIWGYEVFADGSIKVSPSFADRMNKATYTERGLLEMQASVVRFVAEELARIAETRDKCWLDFEADMGLKRGERSWQYRSDGWVIPHLPTDNEGTQ